MDEEFTLFKLLEQRFTELYYNMYEKGILYGINNSYIICIYVLTMDRE